MINVTRINGLAVIALTVVIAACSSSKTVIRDIDAGNAGKLAANKSVTIIDVRTPAEFSAGHLPNAINIDFLDSSFAATVSKMKKNKKYLVYCGIGQRSAGATSVMKEQGFRRVTNMLGGISKWKGEIVKN